MIPTIPATTRIGLDDSTFITATHRVGLSPTSLFKGLLLKGQNNNPANNSILSKVDEIQEPSSLQATIKGVSVAAVVKKFQSFTTSEVASFDDDSEAEGETEELAEEQDHSIERIEESCQRRINEGGLKVCATEMKLLESSPVSTGRFQKRLVYLSSVDKLNSSLDKVFHQKIHHIEESFDPSSLSSDDSQNGSFGCKGYINLEGSSDSYNMNDFAETDSFDGAALEGDRSDAPEMKPLDFEKAEENYIENTFEALENTFQHVDSIKVSDIQEIVIHGNEIHDSISDNDVMAVRNPIRISFFARLFGVNGSICCTGMINSDNRENLDKSQATVSSDNVTSEDADIDNTIL